MPPNTARELGKSQIPEPIMLPTTRAVAIPSPSPCAGLTIVGRAVLAVGGTATESLTTCLLVNRAAVPCARGPPSGWPEADRQAFAPAA
jgi:hypothetical protein